VSKGRHIIVVEPSTIIREGLELTLAQSCLNPYVSKADNLEAIKHLHQKRSSDLVIVSPSLIQNNIKSFNALKSQLENTQWIGLVYAYYDQSLLSMFDGIITISDSPQMIVASIHRLLNTNNHKDSGQFQDVISDREIDVLKLLASGLANKEIADKLNISINTVITHRKNITQKTGIKTISGLTIYAVVQKLISLDTPAE